MVDTAISPKAEIGIGVEIGHGTVVYDHVQIGDGTKIGDFCVIGQPASSDEPAAIGNGSHIRSHSVIYEGAELGPATETGHFVLIRSGARTGTNLRIGSYSSLEGELRIGDYVRLQGNVQVGPGSTIGDFVQIFSLVVATNDPLPPSHVFRPVTVEAGAVVCVAATLMPGCHVGKGAFIAAGAQVMGDVPAAAFVTADGRVGGPITRLLDLETGTRHPWMRHFGDAFPPEAHERINALREDIERLAKLVPRSR